MTTKPYTSSAFKLKEKTHCLCIIYFSMPRSEFRFHNKEKRIRKKKVNKNEGSLKNNFQQIYVIIQWMEQKLRFNSFFFRSDAVSSVARIEPRCFESGRRLYKLQTIINGHFVMGCREDRLFEKKGILFQTNKKNPRFHDNNHSLILISRSSITDNSSSISNNCSKIRNNFSLGAYLQSLGSMWK